MTMDRARAITFIAQHPRYLIGLPLAREICKGIGVHFDAVNLIEHALVRRAGAKVGDLVAVPRQGFDVVQVSDLGAALCRYMGLYGDGDHAKQSPHGTLGKQADYIGQRAAIRLARETGGAPALRDLYQDVPEIPQLLRRERPFRPTNVAGI